MLSQFSHLFDSSCGLNTFFAESDSRAKVQWEFETFQLCKSRKCRATSENESENTFLVRMPKWKSSSSRVQISQCITMVMIQSEGISVGMAKLANCICCLSGTFFSPQRTIALKLFFFVSHFNCFQNYRAIHCASFA